MKEEVFTVVPKWNEDRSETFTRKGMSNNKNNKTIYVMRPANNIKYLTWTKQVNTRYEMF